MIWLLAKDMDYILIIFLKDIFRHLVLQRTRVKDILRIFEDKGYEVFGNLKSLINIFKTLSSVHLTVILILSGLYMIILWG